MKIRKFSCLLLASILILASFELVSFGESSYFIVEVKVEFGEMTIQTSNEEAVTIELFELNEEDESTVIEEVASDTMEEEDTEDE